MKVLNNLLYTKNHEWVKVDGDKAYIGISDYAQHQLGDIVFIELPEVEDELNVEDSFGVIESVKAASDVYMPIEGRIVEVNEEVIDDPTLVNIDPFENWLIVVELLDDSQLDDLLSPEEYEKFVNEEE